MLLFTLCPWTMLPRYGYCQPFTLSLESTVVHYSVYSVLALSMADALDYTQLNQQGVLIMSDSGFIVCKGRVH